MCIYLYLTNSTSYSRFLKFLFNCYWVCFYRKAISSDGNEIFFHCRSSREKTKRIQVSKKKKKNSEKIRIFSKKFLYQAIDLFCGKKEKKKKKKYSWIQIDPFAFPTRTSRRKELAGILVRCRGDHKYVAANYRLISVNENGNERREIEGRIE